MSRKIHDAWQGWNFATILRVESRRDTRKIIMRVYMDSRNCFQGNVIHQLDKIACT
jgi:hypothetical protein